MSRTYFTKGKCDACGISYNKHAKQIDSDPSANIGEYVDTCPNCNYNPEIIDLVRGVLAKGEDNILIRGGKVVINSEKLSQRILEVIVQNWPKPKKKY